MKNFLFYTECLKHLPRTGWLNKNIKSPETVASHSWQMAMMAFYLSYNVEEKYDFDKVIKLCLCHDLAESLIGDIAPSDKKYNTKSLKEKEAIQKIANDCDFSEIISFFDEYEKNITPEANLAHDLDKLDMYIQALDYEKKFPDKDFSEFKKSAESQIKTTVGKSLLKTIAKKASA